MDRATRSTSHPTTGSSHASPVSCAPAAPEPPNAGANPARTTDPTRVGKNAVASAVALGGCFGTMTALNNAVRATPGMPLAARLVTGVLPSLGVLPTPWVEDGVRSALDTQATIPRQPTLAQDAVAGVCLFAFNVGMSRSGLLPRYAPPTPAGMAVTVAQCASASLVAGAASELTAQWMNTPAPEPPPATAASDSIPPPAAPAKFDNAHKAAGRVLSQVPAAALQTGLALAGKPLPPKLSLLPLGVVTGGWSLRRVLMPGPAANGASAPREPSTPWFPVSGFPPA